MTTIVPEDSAFLKACEQGNTAEMRRLVVNRKAGYTDVDVEGETAFCYAIRGGSVEAVLELLTYGVGVNMTSSKEPSTPLALALFLREEAIVRLMLEWGACQQTLSSSGRTPVFYLWMYNRDTSCDATCLSMLCALQCSDTYSFEASLALVDSSRRTPLDNIARRGTAEELIAILEVETPSMSRVDSAGWNVFFNACSGGKLENLRILIQATPLFDVDMRDYKGCTLLHVATSKGYKDIFRYLLTIDADWKAETNSEYQDFATAPLYRYRAAGCSLTPRHFARARDEVQRSAKGSSCWEQEFLGIVKEVRGSLD